MEDPVPLGNGRVRADCVGSSKWEILLDEMALRKAQSISRTDGAEMEQRWNRAGAEMKQRWSEDGVKGVGNDMDE